MLVSSARFGGGNSIIIPNPTFTGSAAPWELIVAFWRNGELIIGGTDQDGEASNGGASVTLDGLSGGRYRLTLDARAHPQYGFNLYANIDGGPQVYFQQQGIALSVELTKPSGQDYFRNLNVTGFGVIDNVRLDRLS